MKRRDFIKTSAAVAASIALPAAAIGAASSLAGAKGMAVQEAIPAEAVTRLRIGLRHAAYRREANCIARAAGRPQRWPNPPDDENNDWAEAIQRGEEFFYRVVDSTVPISEHEYRMVITNPNLYYFSIALKLHCRIGRAREGKPIS